MSKVKQITMPERTYKWRVYKDLSYSENFPWVLEIDGDIFSNYSVRPTNREVLGTLHAFYLPELWRYATREFKS